MSAQWSAHEDEIVLQYTPKVAAKVLAEHGFTRSHHAASQRRVILMRQRGILAKAKLPAPRNWRDQAPCKGKTALFFPQTREKEEDHEDVYAEPKAICWNCPFRPDCLDEALSMSPMPFGVWGGMTYLERHQERRRRARERRRSA